MNPKLAKEAKQVPASSEEHSARSLEDAANSGNSLQGYAAINEVSDDSAIAREAVHETSDEHEEIARLAYQIHLEHSGRHGCHEEDWYKAEQMIRGRHGKKNKPH